MKVEKESGLYSLRNITFYEWSNEVVVVNNEDVVVVWTEYSSNNYNEYIYWLIGVLSTRLWYYFCQRKTPSGDMGQPWLIVVVVILPSVMKSTKITIILSLMAIPMAIPSEIGFNWDVWIVCYSAALEVDHGAIFWVFKIIFKLLDRSRHRDHYNIIIIILLLLFGILWVVYSESSS
jgi:hypothetical protein